MAARTRDGDSAGRLLRVLGDCELFHMETAIASLERVKTGIRSESLLKPSGTDDVDVLKRTAEGRVLSLSDHKRIARLQAALTSVANAYGAQGEVEGAGAKNSNRNLVCTVAGAAMMRSMRDCTASRTNCCIWGPQAEKLHVLLDWMMDCESGGSGVALSTHDYVRQLLLEWIQPTAEKQNQLAACLTLFEVLQRCRRKLRTVTSDTESSCLLGDRFGAYLDALCVVVERGTVRVAGSHHVKPSKLALIALEALALLCADVAAQYMLSSEEAKRNLIDDGSMGKTVESMQFFLVVQRQWHLHSTRRQFLGYALQHLQSYVAVSHIVLSSVKEVEGENACDSNLSVPAALGVLCWHWEATAPLLCTRTDASSRIQKTQPPEVLARVLKNWAFTTFHPKEKHGCHGTITNLEVIYAQLRCVCVLMDSIGGVKGCSKAFGGFPAEMKAYFVFFFVQGLSTATENGAEATVIFILKILRAVLLPSDALQLLSSEVEESELLSQLLRLYSNASVAHRASDAGSQGQTELEFFVADFAISRSIFITELIRRVQDSHAQRNRSVISLVRTFLYQLDSATTETLLHRHWRKVLTPEVLGLIAHENHSRHRLAVSCLPSLDVVSCIAGLCTAGIFDAEKHIITTTLGYFFASTTRYYLEIMVSWYIDACQFGSVRVHSISDKLPASPREWDGYVTQLEGGIKGNIADDDERKETQEKLFSFCFGPNGWNKRVQQSSARSEVLRVLLRKIFGSPRDPVLLRMLREFIGCGWVDHDVFEMMGKQLSAHMMNLPRLSEEFLDDNSFSAAKAIEGLLFSRLAPLLVLRMLPRNVLGANRIKSLLCGLEDLNHLNEYIDRQLQLNLSDSESFSHDKVGITSKTLFHILARSVVDPLEFKEVKMVATECLSKFPPPRVLPFVLAYLVAFLREATPHDQRGSSLVVDEESIPNSCGLVTAKLMVYYLNRVFSEDAHAYRDGEMTSKVLVVLVQILGIPCVQNSRLAPDESLLTDLQRGCIDCIALVLVRLTANDGGQGSTKVPTASASSLVDLLMAWIFGTKNGKDSITDRDTKTLYSRAQELLEDMWSEAQNHELLLQVRICCCNILLSAISRSENNVLASWKTQGFISRVVLATDSCSEEDVVAGGLQIIFSFLYKASGILSMEDNGDLQLVRTCFEATAARLESTRSESVAMNGLKVVGALIGKFPAFVGTLPPVELQRLIDRCLITVRDRQVSPVVSELAQSLLQAMTPP